MQRHFVGITDPAWYPRPTTATASFLPAVYPMLLFHRGWRSAFVWLDEAGQWWVRRWQFFSDWRRDCPQPVPSLDGALEILSRRAWWEGGA